MTKSKQVAMFLKQKSYQLAVGAAVAVASANASAAIDVSPVTTKLSEGEAAVALIGAAVLTVWAIRKVYSMIRG